jgi:hypothetical protein
LESVYNKSFPFKKITIYLTTVGIFPYYREKLREQGVSNSGIEDIKEGYITYKS